MDYGVHGRSVETVSSSGTDKLLITTAVRHDAEMIYIKVKIIDMIVFCFMAVLLLYI